MNLAATLKRAPKWSWYVAGGVGAGIVGIEVWKRRAVDSATAADGTNAADTGTSPNTGQSPNTSPSPVITPPVIVSPPQQDLTGLSDIFGVLGDSVGTLVGTVGGLAAGDQGITGTIAGSLEGISRDLVAQAGPAPAPVTHVGPIIIPTDKPGTRGVAKCPHNFPRLNGTHPSKATCYTCKKAAQVTGHHDSKFPWRHVYWSGKIVKAKGCP